MKFKIFKKAFLFLISTPLIALSAEHELKLPIGKSACPPFTFKTPESWILKIERKKGDRWIIWDQKSKSQIARFDYNLPNTDQKQLPVVLQKLIPVGTTTVNKLTVTLAFPDEQNPVEKIETGLVTSYRFQDGPLENLVLMTDSYEKSSGLETRLEQMLSTIQLK